MKITFADIKIQMRGSELAFLRYAGLSEKQLSGKHQPCEACGGSDRYRTDKRANNGSFFCGQGGGTTGGDWIDHLCHVKSMTMQEVYQIACEYLGIGEMDQGKKAELETKLARARHEAGLKAKLKKENEAFDFPITLDTDEVAYQIKKRTTSKMVGLDEIVAAHQLIRSLTDRYIADMVNSSSYERSEQIYNELKDTSPVVTNNALNEAKRLKSLNKLYFGAEVFGIMCVREMLINRKDKLFIAQVLKAMKSVKNPVVGHAPFNPSDEFMEVLEHGFKAVVREKAA